MDNQQKQRLIELLEHDKPKFPWGQIAVGLVGMAIGALIIIAGMIMR